MGLWCMMSSPLVLGFNMSNKDDMDRVWPTITNREAIAVREARRLNIPVIALVDTNCDPDVVDFPIPANDDAIRCIELFAATLADACIDGRARFKEEQARRPKKEAAAALGVSRSTIHRKIEDYGIDLEKLGVA